MSRATELAKAEAEAVEAVEAQDEADADLEAAVAAEDADRAADDGPSIEASLKAFEKENERHLEALEAIMGDDFEAMVTCENCNGVGFRPADPYKRDPNLATCQACDGYGILVTGSLNPEKAVQACMTCGGNGFVTRPMSQAAPAAVAAAPMFDPFTGQPLTNYAGGAIQSPSPNGEWAPGYTPPPQPFPAGQ